MTSMPGASAAALCNRAIQSSGPGRGSDGASLRPGSGSVTSARAGEGGATASLIYSSLPGDLGTDGRPYQRVGAVGEPGLVRDQGAAVPECRQPASPRAARSRLRCARRDAATSGDTSRWTPEPDQRRAAPRGCVLTLADTRRLRTTARDGELSGDGLWRASRDSARAPTPADVTGPLSPTLPRRPGSRRPRPESGRLGPTSREGSAR